ncbi:TPA: hypothetical protein TXT63_000359 [Streptococcus suis]|nr:hypothetical protein [Streptococcus suis]
MNTQVITLRGVGKNSTGQKRVRLPTPAQLIRSDLECETRTNLPINHCAEMLTRTQRSVAGLFTQPLIFVIWFSVADGAQQFKITHSSNLQL